MMHRKHTSQKGFTLIEIIVSMALFTVVATVAIGAFLKVVDANKKSHTIKTSVTNLNFILESMTREVRVGQNYYCVSGSIVPTTLPPYGTGGNTGCNITSGSWVLAFESSHPYPPNAPTCNLIYAYYFNPASDGSITKAEQTECGGSFGTPIPLLSNDTKQDVVLKVSLGTVKVVTGGSAQPYVQFRFQGSAGATEKVKSVFDIQTTVSQRLRP